MQLGDKTFAEIFAHEIGAWIDVESPPAVLACGMVGSRQGWLEVPYVAAPTDAQALADGLGRLVIDDVTLSVVPGVSYCDQRGGHDVMRGEECQILGELARSSARDGLFVLPGTHCKWAWVENGRIQAFATFLTGELFAIVCKHSILATMMTDDVFDTNAFMRGLDDAADGGGLLQKLFGVRTRGLFSTLAPEHARSFLSGLLIGTEIREARERILNWEASSALPITLIGESELCDRYAQAFTASAMPHRIADASAVAEGVSLIAQAAGLADFSRSTM